MKEDLIEILTNLIFSNE